ncbi:alpha-ketoglutarate-dependent dioxygenase AlkB family protein [Marinomonas algicola]|uniref:alpha-ketoglutarate-dependent dioxygenase AlkB family protein n=1 Tax=Marinomonas algicola TaxID=2773454 RepID=UPI00174AC574|nr:alpha-ketoglutarate-dependent dioxygenase AlkB [Marinomonas algicola]
MNLFRDFIENPENLLDGENIVKYYGAFLSIEEANTHFERLLHTVNWQHDQAIIMGKHITTKRKIALYADHAFRYTYSNVTKQASPWTKDLLDIKGVVENTLGETFNTCLLNLYHDGNEGMAWHSDSEKELKKHGSIASVSLGAERIFSFKNKLTNDTVSVLLEHGSLLVMAGTTQDYWQHRLPPTQKINQPRVNLTFRNIVSV